MTCGGSWPVTIICGFIESPSLPALSAGIRDGSTRQAAAGQSTALMRRLRNRAKRSGVDAAPNGGDETTSRSSQAGPRPPFPGDGEQHNDARDNNSHHPDHPADRRDTVLAL